MQTPRRLAMRMPRAALRNLGLVWILTCTGLQAQTPPTDPVESCETQLASWQAEVLTGDDGPRSLETLQTLSNTAEQLLVEKPDDPRRIELLAQVFRAQLDAFERVSDGPRLTALLAKLGAAAFAALENDDLLTRARSQAAGAAVSAEAFRTAIQALAASLPKPADDPASDDLLDITVATALARGELDFVRRLGQDAVPALARLALRPRGLDVALQADGGDPLVTLVEISPRAALDTALRLVEERDAIGRARVIAAFDQRNPFGHDSVWSVEGETTQLVNPEWARLLTKVAGGTPEKIDRWVSQFVQRTCITDEILPLLPGWIGRGRETPTQAPVPAALVDAAESLLDHEEETARCHGIELLVRSQQLTSLWKSPAVQGERARFAYAKIFGAHPKQGPEAGQPEAGQPEDSQLEDSQRYESALRTFLAATPAGARGDSASLHALQLAHGLATTRGSAVLSLKTLLVGIENANLELKAWRQTLTHHAVRLGDEERTEALDGMLTSLQRATALDLTTSEELLEAAVNVGGSSAMAATYGALARAHAAANSAEPATPAATQDPRLALARVLPMGWHQGDATYLQLLDILLRTPAHLPALEAFALEPTNDKLRGPEARALLKALPQDRIQQLLRGLVSLGSDELSRFSIEDLPLWPTSWLELAGMDEPAAGGLGPTLKTRQWLLSKLAAADGPRLRASDAAALAHAMVLADDAVLRAEDLESLGVPPADVLRALIASGPAAEKTLCSFSIPLDDPKLLELVLRRLPPSTWATAPEISLHREILIALAKREDRALNATLLAANRRYSLLQQFLLEALIKVRSPVHLPIAGAILTSGGFRNSSVRDQAIDLVASFRNDDAARHLLDASRSWPDAKERSLLKKAFEDLVEWQEAERRWTDNSETPARSEPARRADAASFLVEQLSSADAERRISALRGLAALGAVTELPAVLIAFDDDVEAVAKAAREAYARLTR